MYEYPIDQCDVADRTKLAEFRAKREQWLGQLEGSDFHSIWKQLNGVFWHDAIFRIVNESRKISTISPQPDVGFNGAVSRLFDIGFITIQVTAIRRLTEKRNKELKKAVISLRSILEDVDSNLKLITRENYVSFDALPYDPAPLERACLLKEAAEWLDTKGPKAWFSSEILHKHFDKLSGTIPSNRSRDDIIQFFVIKRLIQRLEDCEDVCKYVDKFIAHGADPGNRTGLSEEQKGITLGKLDDCYKALYQVANHITATLLYSGTHGALPVPQYDHLENLDKKWIATNNMGQMHQVWENRAKEIESWENDSWLEKLHIPSL